MRSVLTTLGIISILATTCISFFDTSLVISFNEGELTKVAETREGCSILWAKIIDIYNDGQNRLTAIGNNTNPRERANILSETANKASALRAIQEVGDSVNYGNLGPICNTKKNSFLDEFVIKVNKFKAQVDNKNAKESEIARQFKTFIDEWIRSFVPSMNNTIVLSKLQLKLPPMIVPGLKPESVDIDIYAQKCNLLYKFDKDMSNEFETLLLHSNNNWYGDASKGIGLPYYVATETSSSEGSKANTLSTFNAFHGKYKKDESYSFTIRIKDGEDRDFRNIRFKVDRCDLTVMRTGVLTASIYLSEISRRVIL